MDKKRFLEGLTQMAENAEDSLRFLNQNRYMFEADEYTLVDNEYLRLHNALTDVASIVAGKWLKLSKSDSDEDDEEITDSIRKHRKAHDLIRPRKYHR